MNPYVDILPLLSQYNNQAVGSLRNVSRDFYDAGINTEICRYPVSLSELNRYMEASPLGTRIGLIGAIGRVWTQMIYTKTRPDGWSRKAYKSIIPRPDGKGTHLRNAMTTYPIRQFQLFMVDPLTLQAILKARTSCTGADYVNSTVLATADNIGNKDFMIAVLYADLLHILLRGSTGLDTNFEQRLTITDADLGYGTMAYIVQWAERTLKDFYPSISEGRPLPFTRLEPVFQDAKFQPYVYYK